MTGMPVPSGFDLQHQREAIRRGLVRTTTAGSAIILIVILLALLALYAALRANWNAEEARQASQTTEQELWNAYLAQSRSLRLSGQPGRRFESLAAVKAAAAIRPKPELGVEAIAAPGLMDLRQEGDRWPLPEGMTAIAFDAPLERFAVSLRNGEIRLLRVRDHSEERRWRMTNDFADSLSFSPRGDRLAVGGQNEVLICNPAVEDPAVRIPRNRAKDIPSFRLEFTQDGQTLLVGQNDGSIRFHDVTTGKEQQRSASIIQPLWRIRTRPGSQDLAVSSQSLVVLWDVSRNREIRRWNIRTPFIVSIPSAEADGSTNK